jgi:hypothetical protein
MAEAVAEGLWLFDDWNYPENTVQDVQSNSLLAGSCQHRSNDKIQRCLKGKHGLESITRQNEKQFLELKCHFFFKQKQYSTT